MNAKHRGCRVAVEYRLNAVPSLYRQATFGSGRLFLVVHGVPPVVALKVRLTCPVCPMSPENSPMLGAHKSITVSPPSQRVILQELQRRKIDIRFPDL